MGFDEVRNLAELYERYSGPVFGYLLRLSGDRFLADELTGETFYRAMLALDGFRGEASVKTWLLRIAHNLYLRRAEREKRMTSLEALQEQGVTFTAPLAGGILWNGHPGSNAHRDSYSSSPGWGYRPMSARAEAASSC